MQNSPIEAEFNVNREYDNNAIFDSKDQMKSELSRLCHGNLYIIGKLWIQALRTVLVGAKLSLIPIIKAAEPIEKPPEKPPPMKWKDLPIYESPHQEYKDYVENAKKCPNADVKLLHRYLYPKVRDYRKSWVESITEFNKDIGEMKDDACAVLCQKKKEIKRFLRDPENCALRQGLVVAGAASGYYIGSGGGLLRRIFFTTLGVLAAGSVCFPKETDETFRDVSFRIAKIAVTAYNSFCSKNIVLRERLPCRGDMPPPPPARSADNTNKCGEPSKK